LDIKKAELLHTGEIRLPNGKIIGHRDHRHIYRQRTKLPDQREAIVINKLALDYRRTQQQEAGVKVKPSQMMAVKHRNEQKVDERKNGRAMWKFIHRAQRDHMQIGWKNSKTMMTFFVDRNI